MQVKLIFFGVVGGCGGGGGGGAEVGRWGVCVCFTFGLLFIYICG